LVAKVLSAAVIVVTLLELPSYANGIGTLVTVSARVSVVTRLRIVSVDTCPGIRVAAIGSAWILVITLVEQFPRNALPGDAMISQRTSIGIVAGQIVGLMNTAGSRVTEIVGARVLVRFANQDHSFAHRIDTLITGRT